MKKILVLALAVVSFGAVQAEYFTCIPMQYLMKIANLNNKITSERFDTGPIKGSIVCEVIKLNQQVELGIVSKSETVTQGGNSTTTKYKPSSSKSKKYGVLVCHIAERYFGHRRGIRSAELDPNRSRLNYNNTLVVDFSSLTRPENDTLCIHYRAIKRNRFGFKSPFGKFRLLKEPTILVRDVLDRESSRYSLNMLKDSKEDGKIYTLTNGADPYESFLRKK